LLPLTHIILFFSKNQSEAIHQEISFATGIVAGGKTGTG
jgi:hypothetical protein